MSVGRGDFIGELAGRYGLARKELLALQPGSDPYNSGTPKDRRLAEWFATVYEELGKPRVHLRDHHYAVVVRGLLRPDGKPYTGSNADWRLLCKASSKARDLGLVSPFAFIDRRTQARYRFGDARLRPGDPASVESDADELVSSRLLPPSIWVPSWTVPQPPTLVGVPSALSLQPVAVELWSEKYSAELNAEVLPVAKRFGVDVVVGQGFQSKAAAADLVLRASEDGRERVVLWLADADSSGESMAIATARHTEFLCREWVAFHEPEMVVPRILMDRVALTLDQLSEVEAEIGRKVPLTPDEDRDEGRVELQALAAFAPGWVGAELERRLDELTDSTLTDQLDDWEDEAEEAIEAAYEEAFAASEERLDALIAKRDRLLADLDLDAIKAKLAAATAEIEPERAALAADLKTAIEDLDVTLPDLPEGAVDLDARNWLLDTDRHYEEQLNAYRETEPIHRRRPQLEFNEPVCEECGGDLPPGRRRFCSDAHRKRRERRRRPT